MMNNLSLYVKKKNGEVISPALPVVALYILDGYLYCYDGLQEGAACRYPMNEIEDVIMYPLEESNE